MFLLRLHLFLTPPPFQPTRHRFFPHTFVVIQFIAQGRPLDFGTDNNTIKKVKAFISMAFKNGNLLDALDTRLSRDSKLLVFFSDEKEQHLKNVMVPVSGLPPHGILNMGNTCFATAAVLVLLYCPGLNGKNFLRSQVTLGNDDAVSSRITAAFLNDVDLMKKITPQSLNLNLTQRQFIEDNIFQGQNDYNAENFTQSDPNEYLVFILEHWAPNAIGQEMCTFFSFMETRQSTCLACSHVREINQAPTPQSTLDLAVLSFSHARVTTLTSLQENMFRQEIFPLMECTHCAPHIPGFQSQTIIHSLPRFLLITLKRAIIEGTQTWVNDLPIYVNLQDNVFIEWESKLDTNTESISFVKKESLWRPYVIVAFLPKKHYITYRRDAENKWFLIDDYKMTSFHSLDDVYTDLYGAQHTPDNKRIISTVALERVDNGQTLPRSVPIAKIHANNRYDEFFKKFFANLDEFGILGMTNDIQKFQVENGVSGQFVVTGFQKFLSECSNSLVVTELCNACTLQTYLQECRDSDMESIKNISDDSIKGVVLSFQQILDSKCALAKANDNLASLKKRVKLAYAHFILTFKKSPSTN